MKNIFLFISIIIIGIGAYLKFVYDVPDNQESINFFVSWFLIIVGISSILINLFWKTPNQKNKVKD